MQVIMNHLNVSIPIARPQHEVATLMERYFEEHAPQGEMRFELRAPVEVPVIHVGVTLQRDVTMEVGELGEKHRAYRVSWRPADAGPFPLFKGALVVDEDEERPGTSVLTLDGRYEPPLNIAGYVFDAVLGSKIAHASAADLLSRIGAAMQDEIDGVERAA
jgi:hypothetical protein